MQNSAIRCTGWGGDPCATSRYIVQATSVWACGARFLFFFPRPDEKMRGSEWKNSAVRHHRRVLPRGDRIGRTAHNAWPNTLRAVVPTDREETYGISSRERCCNRQGSVRILCDKRWCSKKIEAVWRRWRRRWCCRVSSDRNERNAGLPSTPTAILRVSSWFGVTGYQPRVLELDTQPQHTHTHTYTFRSPHLFTRYEAL